MARRTTAIWTLIHDWIMARRKRDKNMEDTYSNSLLIQTTFSMNEYIAICFILRRKI